MLVQHGNWLWNFECVDESDPRVERRYVRTGCACMDEIEEFAYYEELRELHEAGLRELDAWIAYEEELRALGLL